MIISSDVSAEVLSVPAKFDTLVSDLSEAFASAASVKVVSVLDVLFDASVFLFAIVTGCLFEAAVFYDA